MDRCEKYRKYFTREYLMGPNSFRLLDELIRRNPWEACNGRVLDLGCGRALTSVFLAQETPAKEIYAYDLWVSASDNYRRIRDLQLEDRIIPIHGDAMDMPFAHDWFDTIVSVDSYHYFGTEAGVFAGKILPFVRQNGQVMIAVPGLKEEPQGETRELFETWAEGDDALKFKTVQWWKNLLEEECGDRCEIKVMEGECFDVAWDDWFITGHEYALRDRKFLTEGLDRILNFVFIYVRKH